MIASRAIARAMRALDHALAGVSCTARWLAVAIALLLFLQWPLREWVQAYSREANDLAQILFAFYVGVAVTTATRAGTHLAVDMRAHAGHARRRALKRRVAALVILAAAGAFAVVAAAPIGRSLRVLEAFPETYNPGYFTIKLALAALTVTAFLQALVDLFKRDPPP